MADNAFVKIGTALLKHQVKKLVGDETLGVISEELADIGGDKLDSWLSDKSTQEEIEKAAATARDNFHGKVNDDEIEQWMAMLPIDNLPPVLHAIQELPTSPDETKLENALRESITKSWGRLSPEQVDNTVNSFLSCLRSALLPIEKQTLMVIGRSVLRTEDKVDLLINWFEQYIIAGKPVEVKQLNPEPVDSWYLAHPYPMPPNFTGRMAELKMLNDWLADDKDRLFILSALGGFGKSALTWRWLTHNVNSKEWPYVLWWSFYEGDSSFENFLKEALGYFGVHNIGQRSIHDQQLMLRSILRQTRVLLILDGLERVLRAYGNMGAAYQGDEFETDKNHDYYRDCINPELEDFLLGVSTFSSFLSSKVLITTRLTPRCVEKYGQCLEGVREEKLSALSENDAVDLFHALGIHGTHIETVNACKAYGYHPLSLRILAGVIVDDRYTPKDIGAAEKIDITNNVVANQTHILEVAYNRLSPKQQFLLGFIACFRAPTVYDTLKSINEEMSIYPNVIGSTVVNREHNDIDQNLKILETRGLLQWDRKVNKYDLHPIVRHYAYDRMTGSERTIAHTRLSNYFKAIDTPAMPKTLNDLTPVIEYYHHMVRSGQFDKACQLFYDRIARPTHYQFGAYQLRIELLKALFPDGEDHPPRLEEVSDQAWALNALATAYSLSGQPDRAAQLLEKQIAMRKLEGTGESVAIGLGNLAQQQVVMGALVSAKTNLMYIIDSIGRQLKQPRSELEQRLYRSPGDFDNPNHRPNIQPEELSRIRFWEAMAHQELSRLHSYRGKWENAEQEVSIAIKLQEENEQVQAQSISWCYRALNAILYFRSTSQLNGNKLESAIRFGQRALELAERTQRIFMDIPVDFIRANWLLGAAYRLDGQLDLAKYHLNEALKRDRIINLAEFEADILLDLARLCYDQENYAEAKSLAEEALSITERCGYVLQGADVNLFLAQYALEQEKDKTKAKGYAEEAKKLATCDGPPYYYKVAYEEAERFLARLQE